MSTVGMIKMNQHRVQKDEHTYMKNLQGLLADSQGQFLNWTMYQGFSK